MEKEFYKNNKNKSLSLIFLSLHQRELEAEPIAKPWYDCSFFFPIALQGLLILFFFKQKEHFYTKISVVASIKNSIEYKCFS